MKKDLTQKINMQQGQVMILSVIFFLVIATVVLVGIATPIANQIRNASDYLQSKQGYIAADTLSEEALYRLNSGHTLPAQLVLAFSQATSTALVTDVNGSKQVIAEGNAGVFSRVSKTVFSQDQGVSINYGLQVGNGGVTMSGSSQIVGNVYANGNISASGSCSITGSAVAAVASSQTADQTNMGNDTPAIDTTFGTSNSDQDIAQSFMVSTSTSVAQVSFYIKKVGTPANATVKLLNNSSGKPGTTVLAQGTLSAGSVTTSYGWVNVAFATNPSLTPGTTYWVAIDNGSNSSSKYYQIGTTNTNTYTSGSVMLGRVGSSWTAANSSYDIYFELSLGGVSSISGVSVGGSGGDVRAYSVSNVTASGVIYCQTGSGNNKSCNTSQATPSPLSFPISDSNIQAWKDQAAALGTRNSSLSIGGSTATTTAGMKIVGNLDVGASGDLTITGPLYVTGNMTMSGSGKLRLASSYGSKSEVIVVDGTVNIGSSGAINGSGTNGSYVIIATTSQCGGYTSCGSTSAITVSGSAGAVVLVAPYGQVNFTGSAGAKAVIAYGMSLSGSTDLNYESGLADISFTSGPSGSWEVDTWREITQ
jgi:hypothetical protein